MIGVDEATGKDRQAPLYELTRQTSLPTMFHDEERPRMSGLSNSRWQKKLVLRIHRV
jgi:hypothetical protein